MIQPFTMIKEENSELNELYTLIRSDPYVSMEFADMSDIKLHEYVMGKWRFLLSFVRKKAKEDNKKTPYVHLGGGTHCAYCHVYSSTVRLCSGCPIFVMTGVRFCRGTPNEDIENHLYTTWDELLKLVEQEIIFLEKVGKTCGQ